MHGLFTSLLRSGLTSTWMVCCDVSSTPIMVSGFVREEWKKNCISLSFPSQSLQVENEVAIISITPTQINRI